LNLNKVAIQILQGSVVTQTVLGGLTTLCLRKNAPTLTLYSSKL